MFSYYLLSTGQKDKACKSLRRFAIIYTIIAIAILIPIFEKSMLKNWNYDSDGHKYLTYTAENCEFNDGKFDLPDSPKGLHIPRCHRLHHRFSSHRHGRPCGYSMPS